MILVFVYLWVVTACALVRVGALDSGVAGNDALRAIAIFAGVEAVIAGLVGWSGLLPYTGALLVVDYVALALSAAIFTGRSMRAQLTEDKDELWADRNGDGVDYEARYKGTPFETVLLRDRMSRAAGSTPSASDGHDCECEDCLIMRSIRYGGATLQLRLDESSEPIPILTNDEGFTVSRL